MRVLLLIPQSEPPQLQGEHSGVRVRAGPYPYPYPYPYP